MTRKKLFVFLATGLAAIAAAGLALVLGLGVGLFAGLKAGRLPIYAFSQTNSAHAGYFCSTLTQGTDYYVSDFDEACLQLANPDPSTLVGRVGFGGGKICAISGQPVTAYIAGDVGSEMSAFAPFRNVKQSPFDWRKADFREMLFTSDYRYRNPRQTTNAALIAEVIHTLRDGTPAKIPGLTMTGITNLCAIKMTCDQLPGLLFCPVVYRDSDGTIYLAESLMMDLNATPPQYRACWMPVSNTLTEWLNGP